MFDQDDFDRAVHALMARHEGSDCFMGAPPVDDTKTVVPIALVPGILYHYVVETGEAQPSGIELYGEAVECGEDESTVHYVPFSNQVQGVVGLLMIGFGDFEFLYFRPTDHTDDGRAAVAVHEGSHCNPAMDRALNVYAIAPIEE